jgi:DNA adenine methylase
LSDINFELINVYQVIKENPKDLIKFLETLDYNKDFYEKIRSWDRQENWQEIYNKIERA